MKRFKIEKNKNTNAYNIYERVFLFFWMRLPDFKRLKYRVPDGPNDIHDPLEFDTISLAYSWILKHFKKYKVLILFGESNEKN